MSVAKTAGPADAFGKTYVLPLPVSVTVMPPCANFTVSFEPATNTIFEADPTYAEIALPTTVTSPVGNGLVAEDDQDAVGLVLSHHPP